MDSQYVYEKQLTIRACGKNDMDEGGRQKLKDTCNAIVQNISRGILNPEALLDKVVCWESLPQIYSDLSIGSSRLGTIVLNWRGA